VTRFFLWLLFMGLGLSARAEPEVPSRIVVLSTSLVSPARVVRLQEAAHEAGLPLQVVSAAKDSPETLASALDGARLLVIDAPHISVAQAAAARFGEAIARAPRPMC